MNGVGNHLPRGRKMNYRVAMFAACAIAAGACGQQAGLAVPMPPPVQVILNLPKGLPSAEGKEAKPVTPKMAVVVGKPGILRLVEERYFPTAWERRGDYPQSKGNAGALFAAKAAVGLEMLSLRLEALALRIYAEVEDAKIRGKEKRRAGMFVPVFGDGRDIGLVLAVKHGVEPNGMPYLRGTITCSAMVGWDKDTAWQEVWNLTFPQIVTSSVRFRYFYTEVPSCQVELAWPGRKPVPVEITATPLRN